MYYNIIRRKSYHTYSSSKFYAKMYIGRCGFYFKFSIRRTKEQVHVFLFFGQRKILLYSLSNKIPGTDKVRTWCFTCVQTALFAFHFLTLPSPHTPRAHYFTPSHPFVLPQQFVNHVCNSQQLSNKALLTGHLAFRHDHAHAHARHFSEDSSAKSGADSACTGVSSKGHQDSRYCGCAGIPDGEASGSGGSGPEAFFPRCWDVRDGGITSLLKAFAVSAAAALLRRAVEADVREYSIFVHVILVHECEEQRTRQHAHSTCLTARLHGKYTTMYV